MKHHTNIVIAPAHCDLTNGGYYVYELVSHTSTGQGTVFYLPGIQQVIWKTSILSSTTGTTRDARVLVDRFLELSHRFPDVQVFKAQAGFYSIVGKDWESAYKHYLPTFKTGMIGEYNIGFLALAALNLGKHKEAIHLLERAQEVFPSYADTNNRNMSRAYAELAVVYAEKTDKLPEALEMARKAISALYCPPSLDSLGVVYMKLGRIDEAQRIYNEILFKWSDKPHIRKLCQEALAECRKL